MSAEIPPPFALYRMISGFYVSQAIYAIVRLGIADCLSDGPLATEELARRSKSHVQSLKRVLRLLVTVGLFTEDNQGRFALTPIGNHLRAGASGSMRAAALLFGGITQRAWGDLLYSVETGEPAFRRVFGQDSFAYFAQHPEEAANFDAAMGGFTAQIAAAVVAAYDFSGVRHIIDVGGGNGTLLVEILRAHSSRAPATTRDRSCRPLRSSGWRFFCGSAWGRRCLPSEACHPRLERRSCSCDLEELS